MDAHAAGVLNATWSLADQLMVKFANGGLTTGLRPDGSVESVNLGYPWWWYALVGTYVMHGNEHPKR